MLRLETEMTRSIFCDDTANNVIFLIRPCKICVLPDAWAIPCVLFGNGHSMCTISERLFHATV